MSVPMEYVTLRTGKKMPKVGLGTWLGKPGEIEEAVKAAIDVGYRHIDCAFVYGNEAEVGQGIAAKIADGTVKREDLFITSKLWNTFHRADLVEVGVRKSLELLKVDYLDLYLIHWAQAYKEDREIFPKTEAGDWVFSDVHFMETWKELEKLFDQGLVKAIGISNFNHSQVEQIMKEGRIKPHCQQIEIHPFFANAKMCDFLRKHAIPIVAYSPLGGRNRPATMIKENEKYILDEELVKKIGEKYGKTPAQVALKWNLQRGRSIIPKSVRRERLEENIKLFDFEMTEDELKQIDQLDTNERFLALPWVSHHPLYPYNEEF